MAHTCTAPQHSAHKLLSAKSKQCGSIHNPEAAKVKTEINCSSNLPTTHLFDLQKVSPVSDAENSISHISQADFSETILSSSSTFCTSMYSTSSTNYNTCRQTSALPFLPHPPKCAQQQQHSAGQSSSSSSLLYGADLNDGDHDDTKHSDDLQDFLNLSGDASESSFHGESKSMAFNDHMEIHFLSEQLGIAMTNNEDSPRLDDIYNGPSQLSSCLVPSFSDQENPRDAGSPLKVQLSSSRAACNKPRLRWTLELHERFVEAVNKLEGPEKATEC
ncbi:hypothetical protein QOZ80_2BG0154610 [Eleusine coracana subsp. coracana]|nr:hypothetical protein QOZ80_2BG0154610 [Eleusine coracana subsp. coracana]